MQDRTTWEEIWQDWPAREPAAHPAYISALTTPDQQPKGLFFETDEGRVLYPILVRPIPDASGFVDLIDPYGYGGPFVLRGDRYAVAEAFWRAFERWATEIQGVSLFGRPSLFEAVRLPWPPGRLESSGHHIVLDLTPSLETLWTGARHKVRKNVKRARRSGITVTIEHDGSHLSEFVDLYESTLRRRNAHQRYYFGRHRFQRLVDEAPGTFAFVHAWNARGEMVSTELVLTGAHRLYSFLGGTKQSAFADRPNDLLKWQIIEWGKESGRTHFVLGAGAQPDDGIYAYKHAFAPQGEAPFHLARWTLNPAASHRLVAERASREEGWTPRDGWFPAYRS